MVVIPSERATVVVYDVLRPPLLKESSINAFTFVRSLGSSNTVGKLYFLLFSALGAVAVKSRGKNCGVPSAASTVLAVVDLPVFLIPIAMGVGHMPLNINFS